MKISVNVVPVLLVVLLAISVALSLLQERLGVSRVLFYPHRASGMLEGQRYFVPQRSGQQAKVCAVVEELMLGPASLDYIPVFPPGTTPGYCILSDNHHLYLDFSAELLSGSDNASADSAQRIAAIRANGAL